MRRAVQLILMLLFSGVALWISFWIGGINLGDLGQSLWNVRVVWVAPFVALTMIAMLMRVERWRLLLSPTIPLTFGKVSGPLWIGFALNGLLPFRAGEFARCYVLKRQTGAPFSAILGTVVLERIFDLIALISFLFLMFWHLGDTEIATGVTYTWGETEYEMDNLIRGAAQGFSIMLGAALVFALLLLWKQFRDIVECVLLRALPAGKFRDKLIEMFHTFSQGMDSMRDPRLVFGCLFWSFMIWIVTAASLQVMYIGFADQVDNFTHMSFMQAASLTVIIAIAVALPSAPGYWGPYEIGAVAGFKLLAMSTVEGDPTPMSFSLYIHFFQMLPIILVGVWFMSRVHVSFQEVMAGKEAATADTDSANHNDNADPDPAPQ